MQSKFLMNCIWKPKPICLSNHFYFQFKFIMPSVKFEIKLLFVSWSFKLYSPHIPILRFSFPGMLQISILYIFMADPKVTVNDWVQPQHYHDNEGSLLLLPSWYQLHIFDLHRSLLLALVCLPNQSYFVGRLCKTDLTNGFTSHYSF